MNNDLISVGVVIVTYNRAEKLKKALDSYDKQEYLPQYILVVNNASTDTTSDILKIWQHKDTSYQKYVVNLDENMGGSGGFFRGEKEALCYGADWVMLADDDAYPNPDYIKGLMQYLKAHERDEISVICGTVLEAGTVFNNHRSMIHNLWKWNYRRTLTEEECNSVSLSIDLASYVGPVINKDKLQKAGLVNKDYFIWNDDIEHCIRLKKEGDIICVPRYVIYHDCTTEHFQFSWKFYYGIRNQLDLFRRHFFKQFIWLLIVLFFKTLMCPLKGRSLDEVYLRIKAIYDGMQGKLGKDKTYGPGWKP